MEFDVEDRDSRLRELIDTHGEHSLAVAGARLGYGMALAQHGRAAEAEHQATEAVHVRAELLGATHPETTLARRVLTDFLNRQEKWPEMATQGRMIVAAATTPEQRLPSQYNLANCLQHMGQHAEAHQLLHEVLTESESVFGSDHVVTKACRSALARD